MDVESAGVYLPHRNRTFTGRSILS